MCEIPVCLLSFVEARFDAKKEHQEVGHAVNCAIACVSNFYVKCAYLVQLLFPGSQEVTMKCSVSAVDLLYIFTVPVH
jgi:hypothetical protein